MKVPVLEREEVEELVKAMAAKVARRAGRAAAVPANASARSREGAGWEGVTRSLEVRKLASLIDHTLLRPEATRSQVEKGLSEAMTWGLATFFVNPAWVPLAAEGLRGSGVKVGSVVGFPLGASQTAAKRAEAETAIRAGAQELDMVMNIGALRSGEYGRVDTDIRGVVEVCHAAGVILKVILENAYLSDDEKVRACQICRQAGADFVKTATGFGPSGATEADVRLMRQTVGPAMGVKAAGGIRTLADALRMLQAGASRLGASASVAILEEAARF